MADDLASSTLATLLLDRIRQSTILQGDIGPYYQYGPNGPYHTYQFLINCMRRQIAQGRQDKNRDHCAIELAARNKKKGTGLPAAESSDEEWKPNKDAKEQEEGEMW